MAAANIQAHSSHCHDNSNRVASQFLVLTPQPSVEKVEEKKEEAKPAVNPFDAASEEEEEQKTEEEKSGNPFGVPEKKEEKPVNPFDAASEEEEEESGNPFGAPEEKKPSANPFDAASEEEKEEVSPLEQRTPTPQLAAGKKQKSLFNIFRRDRDDRKEAGTGILASITNTISSTVNTIVTATSTEEDPAVKAAREAELRKRREEEEQRRHEEEERIRKQREEEERKRREEEERLRKISLIKDKLKKGIDCMKHCSRGKPHPTTITLITQSSGEQAVSMERGDNVQIQWQRKKSLFHGKIGLLQMADIKKIASDPSGPIVTLSGPRELTLEFPTEDAKKEFYDCFPLIVDGIEKV